MRTWVRRYRRGGVVGRRGQRWPLRRAKEDPPTGGTLVLDERDALPLGRLGGNARGKAAGEAEGKRSMRANVIFREKLKTLAKFAELGGEDPVIDQTITKLLDYAVEKHRKDLGEITAKLQALEEQFGMTSDLFSQQFRRRELGDDEDFLRWDALLEMQRRMAQRLAIFLADATT